MVEPLPPRVQNLWGKWNIRGFILFSLLLQTVLIFFAPFRKRTAAKWLLVLIWSAYLLADWAANYSIGQISNNQGSKSQTPGSPHNDLLSFWAPFLLVHFGGPDTITALALEDNEFWLRSYFSVIFQAGSTIYVLILSLPNRLSLPTMLVLIAGVIKYMERAKALFLASLDKFGNLMPEKPDPGPNYARFMEEFESKINYQFPTEIISVEKTERRVKVVAPVREDEFTNLEIVQYAYHFFKTFRGLVTDLTFSFRDCEESINFFSNRSAEDALRIIEVELSFIYEALYTKVEVLYSWTGIIFRAIALCSLLSAFLVFHFDQKKNGYDKLDLGISYTLLAGGVALDLMGILTLIFSDWTFAILRKPKEVGSMDKEDKKSKLDRLICWFLNFKMLQWKKYKRPEEKHFVEHDVLATSFMFRRWSGSISTCNFFSTCLEKPPKRIHDINGFGLAISRWCSLFWKLVFTILWLPIYYIAKIFNLWDTLETVGLSSSEPLTKQMWEFIFKELKHKSETVDGPESAKWISSTRGEWTLQQSSSIEYCNELMRYVVGVDYGQSLLMWHIATELCYQTEEATEANCSAREFSKILSDYMFYLLHIQSTMMSTVPGVRKVRIKDTYAEMTRFLKMKHLEKSENVKEVCDAILSVKNYAEPVAVKGNKSKSVLFDASMLAKKLKKIDRADKKWTTISKVWVELLSFAASQCSAKTHAQELSRGGELVTFIWLLMAHLGIGEQFQIDEGISITKIIQDK